MDRPQGTARNGIPTKKSAQESFLPEARWHQQKEAGFYTIKHRTVLIKHRVIVHSMELQVESPKKGPKKKIHKISSQDNHPSASTTSIVTMPDDEL